MPTKTTERRPTAPARPVLEAERRAARAEQAQATAERETIQRLTANLDDMHEDRDRWRKQAEKLAGALERLRAPASIPVTLAPDRAPACVEGDDDDLLYGVPAIARHLKMTDRQVYHLHQKGMIPLFKIGGRVCWSKSGITRWLAAQAAASNGTGEAH